MPDNQQSSYRSIFKATSLFGGVQFVKILLSIARSKIIAVLLGPTGVGILGLYQSATALIQGITSMGLSSSAIRDVSEANGTGDIQTISRVITILQRLVWVTGLLGAISVILLSPILSRTTFGNDDYVIPFIFLSATLLLDQLSSGQSVVLQGLRRLKDLARASLLGAIFGLLFTIPLYYFMGVDGIVPTLILNSLISLLLTWYFSRKVKIERTEVSAKETIKGGATMLKMGIAMSLSAVMVHASSYLLRGFIRLEGGVDEVGLFSAGFSILTVYVGMVFTAIGTDYYPRLAASAKDMSKAKTIVNQQGEIASLILGPMLMACIVFLPLIITILYSDKFLPASDYIYWSIIGMMFKLGSWLIAYQIIARGDMKIYIVNETAANIYAFIIGIVCYKYLGLAGLGLATTIGFFLYFIQVYFVTRFFYGFDFEMSFGKIYVIEIVVIVLCMIATNLSKTLFLHYLIGIILLLLGSAWSLYQLDNRIGIITIIKNRSKK